MASLEKQAPIHTEYLEKTVDATVNVSEFRKAHSLDSIEDTKPGPYVWLCAAATAIGGMLFGYDTCVNIWRPRGLGLGPQPQTPV
jgi:hypothetical protein